MKFSTVYQILAIKIFKKATTVTMAATPTNTNTNTNTTIILILLYDYYLLITLLLTVTMNWLLFEVLLSPNQYSSNLKSAFLNV